MIPNPGICLLGFLKRFRLESFFMNKIPHYGHWTMSAFNCPAFLHFRNSNRSWYRICWSSRFCVLKRTPSAGRIQILKRQCNTNTRTRASALAVCCGKRISNYSSTDITDCSGPLMLATTYGVDLPSISKLSPCTKIEMFLTNRYLKIELFRQTQQALP